MTMFRCGGGTGLDICQCLETRHSEGNTTININHTVRPGKRLLILLRSTLAGVRPTNLSLNFQSDVAEVVKEVTSVDKLMYAIIKPLSDTLVGTIAIASSESPRSWFTISELPDDLKGEVKTFTQDTTVRTYSLSDLGEPPFHFIGSLLKTTTEPITKIQFQNIVLRTNGSTTVLSDIFCKNSSITPTWLNADSQPFILY